MKLASGEDIGREAIVSATVMLSLFLAIFAAARGFDADAATIFSSWFVRKIDLGRCGLPFAQNVIGATMFLMLAGAIHLGALVRCWNIARPSEGKVPKGTFWWCLSFALAYFFITFVLRQEGGYISKGHRIPAGASLTEACQLSHFWSGADSIFLPGFRMMALAAFATWLTLLWALAFPKIMAIPGIRDRGR